MKPAVIAGGSGNSPNNPGLKNNNNTTANDNNNNNNPNAYANTGFGFNEPNVDDIFSDAGLRSRLNRMRDPFGFGVRKRCGNDTTGDPYTRYFNDDDDFFPSFDPQFDTARGRRRVIPQPTQHQPTGQKLDDEGKDFFGYLPPEFRHYIPDNFGFAHRRHQPQSPKSGGIPPQPQQHHQQQQQHPQQQYYEQQYPQANNQSASNNNVQQKPKFCDASIQTEDLSASPTTNPQSDQEQNLKQHGLRNTVDMGIKSPPEQCRSPRAQSAPPNDGYQTFANASAGSYPGAQSVNSHAYAYTGPEINMNQQPTGQQKYPEAFSQGTQMTPPTPPPRQNMPQYQPYAQHQQQPQQQPQYQSNPQPQTDEGGSFVRNVPIFVEGRSTPVVNQDKRKQGPPSPQQQQQQQRPQGPHGQQRPTPLNTHNETPHPEKNQVPPQTPHTAESISKIQGIQRDVLNLMSKVENFQGRRNDKDYMYLDEMLTRNLLKLDTIDTNGKDSIRLARREAIKCIQASINVLEAKAEENAKTANKNESVMEIEANKEEPQTNSDETTASIRNEECDELKPPPVVVALPPPPDYHQPEENIAEVTPTESVPTEDVSFGPAVLVPNEKSEPKVEPTNEDQSTPTEATETEKTSTDPVPSDSLKVDNDNTPEKDTRSKESPKKKIIRKVKKGEKKLKAPDATPPNPDNKQVENDCKETDSAEVKPSE